MDSTSAEEYVATGVSEFPIARVKRIIKADPEVNNCSNEAVFLISKATELFVKKFSASGYNYSQADKRKTLAYKDLANIPVNEDVFEFLSDILPKTQPTSKASNNTTEETEPSANMKDSELLPSDPSVPTEIKAST
ncbi:histone-fold-containing protein [Basidiobolus meristosporus CBS 931.73]|uniref:Chromatin accessibility complex protein 1 n=1 Tax=Basidiobolus meristosporus CBS 931.73 TaxID=1314790 RepID=A0A1Y1YIH3_9FUNG|nr:histone-fold-containing protein [Basidiobolus meristosporus CBS 931.73]|eukprot:ORX97841.1 histone-fold-containing protein [Basidiobolus meristosporus CBS 931.73]